MDTRKIQVVSSTNVLLHRSRPDVWSKLKGTDDLTNMDAAKARELVGVAVSELLGTAILVGVGCSSVVSGISNTGDHFSHLITALTFAFAITVVVTLFAHISGCHVNPAVSLSALIFGHLSLPRFLIYLASQCLGAVLGAAAVRGLSPDHCINASFCVTLPNPDVGAVKAMLAEAAMTGILVGVCGAAWDRRCQDKHDSLPIKFGLVIAALVLPGAKFSGASLNPARSFGPVVMSGDWSYHWVYWVGPMGGSIVATAIYKIFFSETYPPEPIPQDMPVENSKELLPL